VYFAVAETLTNMAKRSRAAHAWLRLARSPRLRVLNVRWPERREARCQDVGALVVSAGRPDWAPVYATTDAPNQRPPTIVDTYG
jgi:hypothetical protein